MPAKNESVWLVRPQWKLKVSEVCIMVQKWPHSKVSDCHRESQVAKYVDNSTDFHTEWKGDTEEQEV